MRRALLLALLAAGPAGAAPCPPPDPLRALGAAMASPEAWMVIHGRLEFDPSAMPEAGPPGGPPGEGGGPAMGMPDCQSAWDRDPGSASKRDPGKDAAGWA